MESVQEKADAVLKKPFLREEITNVIDDLLK
jgi:hypothetical protein